MTDVSNESWRGDEAEIPTDQRHLSLEQQLALVDRVKSLEAELAQVSATFSLTPTEQLRADQQLIRLRRSSPWRVGRLVTAPFRITARTIRSIRDK